MDDKTHEINMELAREITENVLTTLMEESCNDPYVWLNAAIGVYLCSLASIFRGDTAVMHKQLDLIHAYLHETVRANEDGTKRVLN